MAEEFELEDEIANRIDAPTVSITVRDYIDMTHLRNWIMRDCKDVMDSNGRMLLDKFLQRYKYERPPAVTHTYIAIP